MSKLSEQYAAAMRLGNHELCFAIERRHALDGYPPELVSIGLLALEAGQDPYAAIERSMAPVDTVNAFALADRATGAKP